MQRYRPTSQSMSKIFGMANLNPQKSGLGNIVIWSDHMGVLRNVQHNQPRIKLQIGDMSIVVSISAKPEILSKSKTVTSKVKLAMFSKGIDYVSRNYDIFLKHYMDTDFSFDDEDLFKFLRARGEYK